MVSGLFSFRAVIIIILSAAVLKTAAAVYLGVHPDEAYYWMWSLFPALSYYDQGPFTAVWIGLFRTLMGDSVTMLKTASAAGSAAVWYLTWQTALKAGLTRGSALLALFIVMFIPGLWVGSYLMVHDTAFIFFWSAALFSAVSWLKNRKVYDLYFLFAFLGFGFLSKYTMVFAAAALILWLITEKKEWDLLKNPHFYGGLGTALVIVSPVIVWNIQNEWAGLEAIQYLRSASGNGSAGAYLAGQILTFSPLWFAAVLTAGFYYGKEWIMGRWEAESSVWSLLIWFTVILPLYFLAVSPDQSVQANWVFPSYISGAILLSASVQEIRTVKWVTYSGFAVSAGMILFLTFSVPIMKVMAPETESYAVPGYRNSAWKEIVDAVNEERQRRDPAAGIAANRYQDAAMASWYLPDNEYVPNFNILQKNQYSWWPGPEKGRNYFVFFVTENPCEISPVFFQPALEYMFESVEEYPESEIIKDGKVLKRYQIWYAKNYREHWDTMLIDYINKKAIQDLMPNLADRMVQDSENQNQNKSVGEMNQQFMMELNSRKKEEGCSVMEKIRFQ